MYDLVIVGLGASGGLLLLELLEQNFNGSILVIEQKERFENDKTWSFWEKEASYLDEIVFNTWSKGCFFSSSKSLEFDLYPYEYKTIRSIDFYDYLLKAIDKATNVTLKREIVKNIDESILQTNVGEYTVDLVFDSRPPKIEQNHIGVQQHFLGQVIKTKKTKFSSDVFTMMDFRLKDSDTTSFMYVLPYSETEALVEFTYFSNNIPEKEIYRTFIQSYCRKFLEIDEYEVLEEEYGVIPMSMQDFSKVSTSKVIRIGTAGGCVKPSSGYSFYHSKKRSVQLVNQLMSNQSLSLNNYNSRHRFYDSIFLSILEDYNSSGEMLFETMYDRNKIQSIFKFLNEESSSFEELSIIKTFAFSKQLPLFLKKFVQLSFNR